MCDEHGHSKTSIAFSHMFSQNRQFGTPLCFIIGGAFGVNLAVKKEVKTILKLSDMTLPHELCRVLLYEQIYRAQEILLDSGYHHADVK